MSIINLDDKITPNFTYREFVRSDLAEKFEIKNEPSQDHWLNIIYVATNLQKLRDLIDRPIKILSGYRCEDLNKLTKGSPTSQHMKGQAADIVCPGLTPKDLARFIVHQMPYYDQLILEFDTWVHISFTHSPRVRSFTIRDRYEGYVPGVF